MEIGDWTNFKNLVASKVLLPQYQDLGDRYDLYAPESGSFMWHTVILKDGGSNETDFETNYKSTYNQSLEYRSTDGLPKVANAMFTDAASYWVDGASGQMTILAGQTGYVKTHLDRNFKLSGVDVHWSGSNAGDYINFEVGVYNGDSSNEANFIQLAQFANQYKIMGEGTKMFEVSTVKVVPSTYNGLNVYVRTTYVNAGASIATLLVNLLVYK